MEFEFDDDKPIYKQLVDKLKLEIEKDYNDFHNELYSLLKLTTIKKK